MSHRIVFSPEADAQLIGIYRYIAREASPATAERFTAAIADYCERFETFPERGSATICGRVCAPSDSVAA